MLLILMKYFFYYFIKRYDLIKDQERITASDYTALVNKINKELTPEQIWIKLEKYFKKYKADIKKINLVYDI